MSALATNASPVPAFSASASVPLDDEGWERRRRELEAELHEPVTVDGLTVSWRIFQRKRGHRHSVDDLLTAWYALHAFEAHGHAVPDRALDLGTGIGGVGLLVLSGMPAVGSLVAIEAQEQSFRFFCENVQANGVAARVERHHGDLRHFDASRRFPLVTGSPPYFDVKSGVVPADSQKAHARFELRGDVRDYLRAAARHLEPDGLFVFCFPYAQKARAIAAVQSEGFTIERDRDVIPREGLTPLVSLFVTRLAQADDSPVPSATAAAGTTTEAPFLVRTARGVHTDAMHAVRARFGWPPNLRAASWGPSGS
jgi:tRNA1Val (adenine37-N6)-methyltransferase